MMVPNDSTHKKKLDKEITKRIKKLQERIEEACRNDISHSKKLSNNNGDNKT